MVLAYDRPFYLALAASLLVHSGTILYLSTQKINILKRPVKQIEVTYQAVAVKKSGEPRQEPQAIEAFKEQQKPKDLDILSRESHELPFFEKTSQDISKLSDHFSFSQKESPRIQTLDMSREISVPMIKAEKIDNPKYLSYNESVRQLIKQQAYRYVDNPQFSDGEVYLSFVLGNDGALHDLQVVEHRSRADDFLKTAGLRSIRDANPFPPFPSELKYPELTFNVVISFEVND
jgi:outer membrane biosynthesis protein TonB